MNKTQKEIQRQINYNYISKYLDGKKLILHAGGKERTPEFVNEVNTKVLEIIEKDPSILTITDKDGKNLGMKCTWLGLEPVVLRALDDFEASTQQDDLGRNIGLMSAQSRLTKATSKALDNPIASLQQDAWGCNIAMSVVNGMTYDTELVNKALSNKEACKQTNDAGHTAKDIYGFCLKADTQNVEKENDYLSEESTNEIIIETSSSDTLDME